MMYETAQEVLNAWDSGQSVWTVEMGGLGPGYEQAIQICMFEMLRYMIANPPVPEKIEEEGTNAWRDYKDEMDKALYAWDQPKKSRPETVCSKLGLSGAQHGAAAVLAYRMWRDGNKKCVESAPEDRHIQVSKNFPG